MKTKNFRFSTKKINNWQRNLKDWELNLVNYLCYSHLKKLGYKHNIK